MGTNYYLRARPACDHCGRGPDQGLHIGKSSGGWCFGLRVYPDGECQGEPAPRDLAEWIARFPEGIVNEYGEDVDPQRMLEIITDRTTGSGRPLHRHDPRPGHCLGPGDGTYDLMVGYFS